MAIFIYGGSFDPFHLGHQHVIESIPRITFNDKIYIVPTYHTPAKEKPIFSNQSRLEILNVAINSMLECGFNRSLLIDTFEIDKGRQVYAIETVTYFKRLFPNENLNFVMGTDCFFNLHTWKQYKELMEMVLFYVVKREQVADTTYESYINNFFRADKSKFKFIDNEIKEISSTEVRSQLSNVTWQLFVPKQTIPLIEKRRLW